MSTTNLSNPRTIIFDCDGTLVDSVHYYVDFIQNLFKENQLIPPPHTITRQAIGLNASELLSFLLTAMRQNLPPNVSLSDLVTQFKAGFHLLKPSSYQGDNLHPLFDGALVTIKKLAQNPHNQLAIATGLGKKNLQHILNQHKLTPYFKICYTADQGPSKPNPYGMNWILQQSQSSRENAIMIGDTVFDMEFAKNHYVKAIGVNWGNHPVKALIKANAIDIAYEFHDLLYLIDKHLK